MSVHPDLPEAADTELAGRLAALLDQEYPRFAPAEMHRRRGALEAVADEAGVGQMVMCGENRSGSGVQWLTGWPVTAEALAVFTPSLRDALFVQYYNHVPLARRLAADAHVQWGGSSAIDAAVTELHRRGARRVGVMGPLGHAKYSKLAAAFEVVDLNTAYLRLRCMKSADEIDWLRVGAAFSDAAVAALRSEMKPGITERELWNITERAYVGKGGTTAIHYFGVTAMADPDCCVPRQFASNRRLQAEDVVLAEISGMFWDYSGQVLRSFTIEAEPTPLYRDLYAVADAAYSAIVAVLRHGATMAEIVDASAVIEDAGFTTCDDLLHGYGGGYLPPILGSRSRPAGPLPAMTLEAGMTVVVQPNVVTRDARAGVQVGELLLVTATGCERLHEAPRDFFRVG